MRLLALVGTCALGGTAHAESINVAFGPVGSGPPASYAGAGQAGAWNTIEGSSSQVYQLVAGDGSPTNVMLHQSGSTTLLSSDDPSVGGDDAKLLDHALIDYDANGGETCLFVDGLAPGVYEVIMYGWMPGAPDVKSRIRHDLSATTVEVGGAWTGAHAERVTYARHILTIDDSGLLGSHSGIAAGGLPANGAALNGFQIRPYTGEPPPPDPVGDPVADPPPQDGGCAATRGSSALVGLALVLGLRRRRR